MQSTEVRTFETPDETRKFPHGRAEIVRIGVSGRLAIRMDDATGFIAGPGDIPGCRAATTPGPRRGPDPVIVVDRFGASNYAKQS